MLSYLHSGTRTACYYVIFLTQWDQNSLLLCHLTYTVGPERPLTVSSDLHSGTRTVCNYVILLAQWDQNTLLPGHLTYTVGPEHPVTM